MKRLASLSAAGFFLLGTFGLSSAYAAPNNRATNNKVADVTGCLQQGPDAREYTIKSSDGSTWEISTPRDVYLNNYVGETVTVAGDQTHSPAKTQQFSHHRRAYDVVVDSQGCNQ